MAVVHEFFEVRKFVDVDHGEALGIMLTEAIVRIAAATVFPAFINCAFCAREYD